jgi:hypothetical protein
MVQSNPGPQSAPPHLQLFQQITGFWVTQALAVAAQLGVADHMQEGTHASADLAGEVGAHPAALYRLLRALSSVGVVSEESPDRFRLTPLGACLQTGHPRSMHAAALFYGNPAVWSAWGNLLDSVRTGEPAFDRLHGRGMWQYQEAHPDLAATFHQFMTSLAAGREEALLVAYDFTGITTLVDVAGGSGALLAAVLRAYPAMRGILFDRSQATQLAGAVLAAAGVAERCTVVEGDIFATVPAGGDAYVLSAILHDWDDVRAGTILRNCQRAMQPGQRLLVLELVVPPERMPPAAAFLDLNMQVLEGGKERTLAEFKDLFAATGFELTRAVPLVPPRVVIECVRR